MDNELIALIKLLTEKMFLGLNDVQSETNSTRRQVEYRLDKINTILQSEGYPVIGMGKEKELIIAGESKNFLIRLVHDFQNEALYYLNKKERKEYIFLMMFLNPEYLKLQTFIELLNVSRSTVLMDLKELSTDVMKLDITIQNDRSRGYYLAGPEMNIRRYMMQLVILSISLEHNTMVFDLFIEAFHLDIFDYSRLVITELAEKNSISFVEDRLIEFIYIFIFLKSRIINSDGSYEVAFNLPDLEMMKSLKEYTFTKQLLTFYPYTAKITESELNYISSWILGISVGNVEEDNEDCLVIGEIVGKIMTRFEFLSGIRYKDTEEIFRQIFSHFRPAYYRLLFKLPIFNPLQEKVKEEYKELFSLVKETMKPFNYLFGEEIVDDELAYLTIHFATIYSRNRVAEQLEKKQALIICSNGIGSSAMLYSDLKSTFPEFQFYLPVEANKINEFTSPVDIIFTTQFLRDVANSRIPVVRVSPIMDNKEKYEVIREVYMRLGIQSFNQPSIETMLEVIRKYATIHDEENLEIELVNALSPANHSYAQSSGRKGYTLLDMISKETISLKIAANNWEEAIRMAGEKMVVQQKVTQNYVDEIIRVSRNIGPFSVITKHVALPHTLPERGALECAIGISTLKKPIVFGSAENDPVKYVFFLSALDNEQHLPAMSELLELLNMKDFYKLLDEADSVAEIIEFLEAFEVSHFKNHVV